MKCKDCKYFDKFAGLDIGKCTAHPSEFTVDRVHDPGDVSFWNQPVMNKNDGCGEFVQKEAA